MSESGSEPLVEALAADEYDYVSVDELHEHPRNEEVYGELDPDDSFLEDIEQNGVETPLIVNQHPDTEEEWGLPNTVIGGHRRLEAARRVGLKKVPVRWKEYPEPMATRRLVLNNKQREKNEAQITREALVLEETAREIGKDILQETGGSEPGSPNLENPGFDWAKDVGETIGVSKNTIRSGVDVFRFAYPDKYVHEDVRNPEKYDVSESVREVARQQAAAMEDGQSFHGAKKRIEDAIRQEEIKAKSVNAETEVDIRNADVFDELQTIEDGSIDLLLTDPPYGVMDDEEWDDFDEYLTFFERWFSQAAAKLKDEHIGFVFADARRMYELQPIISEYVDLKNTIIWVRKNMSQGRVVGDRFISSYEPVFYFGTRELNLPEDWGSERSDVKEFAVPQTNTDDTKYHPTQKPLDLIKELVEVGSYPGDMILDCFAGVLTTGVAVQSVADRSVILIERDQEYVDIGRGRINEL